MTRISETLEKPDGFGGLFRSTTISAEIKRNQKALRIDGEISQLKALDGSGIEIALKPKSELEKENAHYDLPVFEEIRIPGDEIDVGSAMVAAAERISSFWLLA